MVKQINNQMVAPRPAHEQKHVCMTFKGVSTRSKANSYLCKQYAKNNLQLKIRLNH